MRQEARNPSGPPRIQGEGGVLSEDERAGLEHFLERGANQLLRHEETRGENVRLPFRAVVGAAKLRTINGAVTMESARVMQHRVPELMRCGEPPNLWLEPARDLDRPLGGVNDPGHFGRLALPPVLAQRFDQLGTEAERAKGKIGIQKV